MQWTQWNDEEDKALRKVTWMARLVYLQGIRKRMDYATGIAGKVSMITYQNLAEMLDCTEHTTAPDPRPTKRMLQRAFESLERAGLVEWIKPPSGAQQRGIVFRCLLADAHQSVQKQVVPKRYPSGTQQAVPSEASIQADLLDGSGTQPSTESYGVAVPPQDNQTIKKKAPQSWSPPEWMNRDAWAEFEQHRINIRHKLTDDARRKNAKILEGLTHAQQQEVIDNSIRNNYRGLFPLKVNGSSHHGQQPANPPTPARRRRLSDAA